MSVSASHSEEVQSVTMRLAANAGSTENIQIDADQDRRIVGWNFAPEGIDLGSEYKVDAKLFLGTDPNPGPDNAEDIGSKFVARTQFTINNDTTNGVGSALGDEALPGNTPSDVTFDWNEDVTLTLEATNSTNSTDAAGVMAEVYYVET